MWLFCSQLEWKQGKGEERASTCKFLIKGDFVRVPGLVSFISAEACLVESLRSPAPSSLQLTCIFYIHLALASSSGPAAMGGRCFPVGQARRRCCWASLALVSLPPTLAPCHSPGFLDPILASCPHLFIYLLIHSLFGVGGNKSGLLRTRFPKVSCSPTHLFQLLMCHFVSHSCGAWLSRFALGWAPCRCPNSIFQPIPGDGDHPLAGTTVGSWKQRQAFYNSTSFCRV